MEVNFIIVNKYYCYCSAFWGQNHLNALKPTEAIFRTRRHKRERMRKNIWVWKFFSMLRWFRSQQVSCSKADSPQSQIKTGEFRVLDDWHDITAALCQCILILLQYVLKKYLQVLLRTLPEISATEITPTNTKRQQLKLVDVRSKHYRKVWWMPELKNLGGIRRNADNRQNNDAMSHRFIAQRTTAAQRPLYH